MAKSDVVEKADTQNQAKLVTDASNALVQALKDLQSAGNAAAQPGSYRFLFPLGISTVKLKFNLSAEIEIEVSGGTLTGKDEGAPGGTDVYIDTAPDELYLDTAFPKVEAQLKLPAPGVYGTHTPERRWGTARTVQAIEAVAKAWHEKHPDLRFGVGDISKRGGGPISGHVSHQHGVDFDVRPLRKDRQEAPVVWQDSQYSRDLTKDLIQLLIDNGIAPVKVIFFDDPQIGIDKVHKWPNHDNHFHVRFELG